MTTFDHEDPALPDEPEDTGECPDCAGTGEGTYDGAICRTCKGHGILPNASTHPTSTFDIDPPHGDYF